MPRGKKKTIDSIITTDNKWITENKKFITDCKEESKLEGLAKTHEDIAKFIRESMANVPKYSQKDLERKIQEEIEKLKKDNKID